MTRQEVLIIIFILILIIGNIFFGGQYFNIPYLRSVQKPKLRPANGNKLS